MPDSTKPATGPLIMEQVLQLADEVKAIRELQERRERREQALSAQIDRFLAAEIDITATLVQVRSVVSANRDTVNQLRAAAIALERTIHGAIKLAVSDPGVGDRAS